MRASGASGYRGVDDSGTGDGNELNMGPGSVRRERNAGSGGLGVALLRWRWVGIAG